MANEPELRSDVPLSSGCTLVLLWDGGEYYIRLIQPLSVEEQLETGKRFGYATRWLIVTHELMESLKTFDPKEGMDPIQVSPLTIELSDLYMHVRFKGELAGWSMTYLLTDAVADLLATVAVQAEVPRWTHRSGSANT